MANNKSGLTEAFINGFKAGVSDIFNGYDPKTESAYQANADVSRDHPIIFGLGKGAIPTTVGLVGALTGGAIPLVIGAGLAGGLSGKIAYTDAKRNNPQISTEEALARSAAEGVLEVLPFGVASKLAKTGLPVIAKAGLGYGADVASNTVQDLLDGVPSVESLQNSAQGLVANPVIAIGSSLASRGKININPNIVLKNGSRKQDILPLNKEVIYAINNTPIN